MLVLGLGLGTWTVLKHRNLVLGLVLGFEGKVLGLGLGLAV